MTAAHNNHIRWADLGLSSYEDAWNLQEEIRQKRIKNLISDTFIFTEHRPVFTLGKKNCDEDFISQPADIAMEGIKIVKTNRGGRITYHAPGQVIGYFIFNLEKLRLGIKDFVHSIEDIIIKTLGEFGIGGVRDPEHPGIWIGKNKIAAIGLNITHNVTEHGFALNVDCDLGAYRHIVPCGIMGRGVTSMRQEVKTEVDCGKVKQTILRHIGMAFSRKLIRLT